jgi:hypothetical protein
MIPSRHAIGRAVDRVRTGENANEKARLVPGLDPAIWSPEAILRESEDGPWTSDEGYLVGA